MFLVKHVFVCKIKINSKKYQTLFGTVCPRSLDPFCKITSYIKGVKTSLRYSISDIDYMFIRLFADP
mgnify:CR=1 FL=1